MVTMHVMNHDVPFHAARAESAAAPFSLAPLDAHRHRCLFPASEVSPLCVTRIKRNTPKTVMAGNKTPDDLSLPRTVAFAAARQRTQCHCCRSVHRRRCFFPASKKTKYMSGNNHSLSHACAHAILRAVPFAAPYFCTQASRDGIPVNGICCTACSEFYQKPSSRYIPDTVGTRLPVVMVCAAEKDW